MPRYAYLTEFFGCRADLAHLHGRPFEVLAVIEEQTEEVDPQDVPMFRVQFSPHEVFLAHADEVVRLLDGYLFTVTAANGRDCLRHGSAIRPSFVPNRIKNQV